MEHNKSDERLVNPVLPKENNLARTKTIDKCDFFNLLTRLTDLS